MAEWEIIDGDDYSETSDEEPSSPSINWLRWGLIVGLLGMGVIGGYQALQAQQSVGQAAVRADLEAIIFQEQAEQALGNLEQIPNLMLSTAPTLWQSSYEQTFSEASLHPPPGTTRLTEIDFDGTCAIVEVQAAENQQVRHYCLEDQQWRRAPVYLEAWGDTQDSLEIQPGLTLRFRERDLDFGSTLAADLKQFTENLAKFGMPLDIPPGQDLRLIIEPHDLAAPLISDDPQRILLNSPKLVTTEREPYNLLTNEDAVRLVAAQALMQHTHPLQPAYESTLPGHQYILAAAELIVPMQLLLSPEIQTTLRQSWLDHFDGRWISPFVITDNPVYNRKSEIMGRVIVDHIYRRQGPLALKEMLSQIPDRNSWDTLFQSTLHRPTLQLSQDVISAIDEEFGIQLDWGAYRRLQPPRLPFAGSVETIDFGATSGYRLELMVADHPDPIVVEVSPELRLNTDEEGFLPAGCIPPDSTIQLEGEWLEKPSRLQAQAVDVLNLNILALAPAPANTLALLVEDESSAEQTGMLNHVFLASQTATVVETLPETRLLLALTEAGASLSERSTTALAALSQYTRVYALPTELGQASQLLFKLDLPTCNRSWFVHYGAAEGIIGQWLGPPNPIGPNDPLQWLWRPDRQDLLFFVPRGAGRGFEIYKSGSRRLLPDPVSQTFAPFAYLGWNIDQGRPINVLDWFRTTYIGSTNLTSGGLDRIHPFFDPVRAFRLSPEGNWLAYLSDQADPQAPATRLGLLHLTTKQDTTFAQTEPTEGFTAPTWSPYLGQTALAVLAGPANDGLTISPHRLLLVSPTHSPEAQLLVEAKFDEQFGTPIFCADGSLLYRVQRGDQYEVRQQALNAPPVTLYQQERLFRPVVCF